MSAFDKIIAYSSEKQELRQIADTLKNREVYEKLGASSPHGLLLYGDPGVGKTLMATALIEESGRPAFTCRKNQPDGDFIKFIKETFDKAAKNAPSIVFLDDLDKFANEDEHFRDAEEYVAVQACIDDVKDKEVFVLATANNIRKLPSSLRRAGRFDRTIEIEAPHGANAEKIVAHYLSGKKFVSDMDPKIIARIMDGRSCAELETVLNEAGLLAGYERSKEITTDHFMAACLKTVFDVPAQNFDDDEDDDFSFTTKRVIPQAVYHEAGHAVVSEILCPGSVSLVSVHAQHHRSGGFTSYYNDRKLSPMDWLRSHIICSLAGRVAEEIYFGKSDGGECRDLDQAFRMTGDLVVNHCSCGLHLHSDGHGDSENLSARQEQTVADEVERYCRIARELLVRNAAFVEKLADALAKKSLLTMVDIAEIKKSCTITPVSMM